MRRALSWIGFLLIAAAVVPRLPPTWTGVIVACVVAFLFMPAPD